MWQPDFYTPANGVPYAQHHRVSAMTALIMTGGQFNLHTAGLARACPVTLRRYMQRMVNEGHFSPREHTGGPEPALGEDDALFLWLWTMQFPATSCKEAMTAISMFRGVTISESTVCREWARLGLSRKIMICYSTHWQEWPREHESRSRSSSSSRRCCWRPGGKVQQARGRAAARRCVAAREEGRMGGEAEGWGGGERPARQHRLAWNGACELCTRRIRERVMCTLTCWSRSMHVRVAGARSRDLRQHCCCVLNYATRLPSPHIITPSIAYLGVAARALAAAARTARATSGVNSNTNTYDEYLSLI